MSRFTYGYENNEQNSAESTRMAVEISNENIAHVAENKILKEQNKIDDDIRNEYDKKISDLNAVRAKSCESEKWNKQIEYRDFLLKQIHDKEECKKVSSPEIQGNAYAYSEELIAPELKKNLKWAKQQEMKHDLDECIRLKNALKLENKQKEIEEEKERIEFLKKREADELMIRQTRKHQTEMNEQRKEDAAKTWTYNKDEERDQFVESLSKKDTTFSQMNNENLKETSEDEKSIQLEENEEIANEELVDETSNDEATEVGQRE